MGLGGLLLDGDGPALPVELHDAEALGVVHVVAEDRGAARLGVLDGARQVAAEPVAVEDVVAEHQGARLAGDELLADGECLRQAIGARLLGVGALGALGLLLDGDGPALAVELHDAEALGVVHVVAEDRGAARLRVLDGLLQVAAEAVAVEDVVAEHQRARLAGDELLADGEGLGQAVGARLLGVGEVDAVARAVTEQALEVGQVGRRGDDQDVPDARQHEGGQRVIDHGLVVDRQQLLGGHERERV